MKKSEWWNKPMTRRNWLGFITFGVSLFLMGIGYMLYSKSIKDAIKKWEAQLDEIKSEMRF